jgi:RHS repeat-associated protein
MANLLTGGIDEVFTRTDSSGTANFLTDVLGSTLALTSSSGSTLAQYAYEPFGNTFVTSGSSASSYEYTGRENDGTGLYFYRARYYNPALQRFVSEDPIGFGGGDVNLYAYVSNDPISSKDSFGMARDCFASWCGGVPRNPLPGRKDPSGAGTPKPSEPNPVVTGVADVLGVVSAVGANRSLGAASTAISVANDHSPQNIVVNVLGLLPGPDVPIAFGSAAYDGSQFVTNQILAPVFNAAPTQNINVDVGNGNLLTIPNPALDFDGH